MDIIALKERCTQYIQQVEPVIPELTYTSIIVLDDGKMVTAAHNNFQGWGDRYYQSEMQRDCVLKGLPDRMRNTESGSHMIWNSIFPSNPSESEVFDLRKSYGIFHGISFIVQEAVGSYGALLSFCTHADQAEDHFYAAVLSKRDTVIQMARSCLG